jgi:hypothetical protein
MTSFTLQVWFCGPGDPEGARRATASVHARQIPESLIDVGVYQKWPVLENAREVYAKSRQSRGKSGSAVRQLTDGRAALGSQPSGTLTRPGGYMALRAMPGQVQGERKNGLNNLDLTDSNPSARLVAYGWRRVRWGKNSCLQARQSDGSCKLRSSPYPGSHCQLPCCGGLTVLRCIAKKKFFFLNEQCGNVYENKGHCGKMR